MHEALHHFLHLLSIFVEPADPATTTTTVEPSDNSDIYKTLIIVGGSVLTALIGFLVQSIQRDRSPRSTVESNEADVERQRREESDRQERWVAEREERERDRAERERLNHSAQVQAQEQNQFVLTQLQDATQQAKTAEKQADEAQDLYRKLREACRANGMDPDRMMQELEAT